MFEIFCNSLVRFNWFSVRSNYKWTTVDGQRKEAAEMTENWMVFWLRPKSSVPKVSCFGQEKWLKEFKSHLGLASKLHFGQLYFSWKLTLTCLEALYWSTFKRQIWSRFEVRCWTKNAFSKNLQNMIQISQKSNFGLISYFESGPNLPFGTIWKWTKLAFWHVIINCDQNNVD